ncbi:MAG: 50S ribosomal protein L21 [Chloroflexota bacterium]
MYAIIRTGGRQYRVEEGRYLDVEKLPYDEGEQIEIDEVLLVSNGDDTKIGQPVVEGARVKATVMKQWRDKKVIVYKYRQRTNYRRRKSHRHHYTRLMVDSISV